MSRIGCTLKLHRVRISQVPHPPYAKRCRRDAAERGRACVPLAKNFLRDSCVAGLQGFIHRVIGLGVWVYTVACRDV